MGDAGVAGERVWIGPMISILKVVFLVVTLSLSVLSCENEY